WIVLTSFWRTSRLSDGHISFSQASTGGKNNPLPPYDTILPPTGIHPLNAIARIGTVTNTAQSAKMALRRYEGDPEIVAAAVSALAALYRGRIPAEVEMGGVNPATRMLAAMQTVTPKLLGTVSLAIDIDTADAELLKLALIVIGLNRDIQHLLHPRHENGAIIKALGQHDDAIVRQYSVWAVIENSRLGPEHLGIPFSRLEAQPSNVQSKLLQLAPTAIPDPIERQDVIIAGSNQSSIEAREGLARGLVSTFYDGLQDVTLSWSETETDERVLLPLAEHFARHADNVPSYRVAALDFYDRGAAFRERIRLGAEGTRLYAEVRNDQDGMLDLFGGGLDPEGEKIMKQTQAGHHGLKVLMLNATPDPQMPVASNYRPIRPDKEAMELRDRLAAVPQPRRQIAFETLYATRPDQIQQEMLRHEPKILHFSGHGGGGALAFETRDGRAAPVTGDQLAQIAKVYGDLECIVLHACYSDSIAQACEAHVSHIIGSTDAINDETAPSFTYIFYQALAMGRPYAQAFEMGQAEVGLTDKAEAAKYKIRSK
ncbi:CHAT domain-containing protein, partial [Marivita sp.]|uniref:CHAT domain-containing protein n=1 Tax=Marivita sp. TaxID=2003365 RepID=UPI00260CD6A1